MRFKNTLLTLLFSLLFALMGLAQSQVAQAKAVEGVVNINTAPPAELMLLPGIGKAKADQIIQIRQAKPFASVDDLKAIKGLGANRLEALRANVSVTGPSTAKAIKAPKASVQQAPAPATGNAASNPKM